MIFKRFISVDFGSYEAQILDHFGTENLSWIVFIFIWKKKVQRGESFKSFIAMRLQNLGNLSVWNFKNWMIRVFFDKIKNSRFSNA